MLHRLDRDTSGALALALTREAACRRAARCLPRIEFERHYLAIVHGVPAPRARHIRAPITSRYASGRRGVARGGRGGARRGHALYRSRSVRPDVARWLSSSRPAASIRSVHIWSSSAIRSSGERIYATAHDRTIKARRPMLHAWKLAFPHPLRRTDDCGRGRSAA